LRFFRLYDSNDDPAELLRPENQRSTPWGSADRGPCDKCGGSGQTRYACRSCLEGAQLGECPACRGRVEFEDVCPACGGDGVIDKVERVGVSAFPAIEGLYRYLVECDAELEGQMVVEVEGELGPERDLDADQGAVLVLPEQVLGTRPIDWPTVERLRRRFR
jgi:hypothetical protein